MRGYGIFLQRKMKQGSSVAESIAQRDEET